MQTIKAMIGNTEVLINAIDDVLDEPTHIDSSGSLKNTTKTGLNDGTKNAFDKAKNTIFSFVDACENELESREKKPSEMVIEFSMAFSAKGDIWVIGCEGNAALKVSLKWTAK